MKNISPNYKNKMFENITEFCKYIYETLSHRYNNILIDHRRLLEENTFYCKMQDGGFLYKDNIQKEIIQEKNKEDKIKERMNIFQGSK